MRSCPRPAAPAPAAAPARRAAKRAASAAAPASAITPSTIDSSTDPPGNQPATQLKASSNGRPSLRSASPMRSRTLRSGAGTALG